ncbi:MAG: hypothetical protein LKF31_05260 [Muribaculaceae bacterium]|jgi:hypothetical protein|nr:hypothetical protein [Muribaculaceae bacterium]
MKGKIFKLTAAIAAGVVCFGFSSCHSTYYQVYDVNASSMMHQDNSLNYENEDLKVMYNLWGEEGSIGFVIMNKTSKDIFIDMGQTFFIKNGAANDYFKNREYATTNTTEMTLGYSVSRYYSGSDVWSNRYYVPTTIGSMAKLLKGTSNSVTIRESEFVCVPANSWKVISEYNIYPELFLTCDKKRDFPSLTSTVASFTETTTPLKFKNRIAYSFTKDGNGLKHIENDFYVSGITNYSKKGAISKEKSKADCYSQKETREYFKISGPDRFYKTYNHR